jgi:hypothetical protein
VRFVLVVSDCDGKIYRALSTTLAPRPRERYSGSLRKTVIRALSRLHVRLCLQRRLRLRFNLAWRSLGLRLAVGVLWSRVFLIAAGDQRSAIAGELGGRLVFVRGRGLSSLPFGRRRKRR